jgi:hypothetical protein
MNKLNICALLISLTTAQLLVAHSEAVNGVLHMEENRRPVERRILQIPDIGGFQTLKCDLHMHTVFSDGLVWPSIRIEEAWSEGLDAIAITDHIEYQPHKKDIPSNHNRPYHVAKKKAAQTDIILIKGSELTRATPPGHFNAIFNGDASVYISDNKKGDLERDREAIDLAAEQGSFIFWNHPGWKADQIKGSYEWLPFVDQLLKEGKLHGIEVVNSFYYYPKALDWALEHDLTILGTSDIHHFISEKYDMERGATRSMSLVFAKERSPEGIREALEAGRSVAWSTKLLAGKERWIRALYDASVSVAPVHTVDKKGSSYRSISNSSDLHFQLELKDAYLNGWPETISLRPQSSQILKIEGDSGADSAQYIVKNAYIGGSVNLVVELP